MPLFKFKNQVTDFMWKKAIPFFAIAIGVLVFSAVILPIAIVNDLDILLYITCGLSALAALSSIIFGFIFLKNNGREIEEATEIIERQLEEFAEGQIRVNNALPTKANYLTRLQNSLNSTLQRYSSFKISAVEKMDEGLAKKIEEGHLFSLEEFKELLYSEIQRNRSFRSALFLVKIVGDEPIPEKVVDKFRKTIAKRYKGSIIGRYSEDTLVFYVYSIDSLAATSFKAQKLMNNLISMEVSPDIDSAPVYSAKISGVVYPYIPMANLLSEAEEGLKDPKGFIIKSGVSSVYYPHAVLTESNRRVIYLASLENFCKMSREAKDYHEQYEIIKEFSKWFASVAEFETAGILIYKPEAKCYDLLFEVGLQDNFKSFSLFGNRVEEKNVDPFYDAAVDDLTFSACDCQSMPPEMSTIMHNIKIESFYMLAMTYGGVKQGLVYLTSSKRKDYWPLLVREIINTYSALCSSMVVSMNNARNTGQISMLLDSLSTRTESYLYSIDRNSHRITWMSSNLRHAFPEAKEGDLCYKCFRTDHTAPCSHCPLEKGTDHRVIGAISSKECAISVLQFKGERPDIATIMVQETKDSLAGGDPTMYDPMLMIKNEKAFNIDFQRALKNGQNGYILAVRFVNIGELSKNISSFDINSGLSSIVKNIQDDGSGDMLYRYNEDTLYFLLKSYTKPKMYSFVESIADVLSRDIETQTSKYRPKFSYSAFSYPGDIQLAKQLPPILESELNRSFQAGDGRLSEVGSKELRKANRLDYVLDVMQVSLAHETVSIEVQPVAKTFNKSCYMGDCFVRLYDSNNLPFAAREFLPVAKMNKLGSQLDLAVLKGIGKLYENYAFTTFQAAGVHHMGLYISEDSILDPHFCEEVKKVVNRYKFPKNYVVFQIHANLYGKYESEVSSLMFNLQECGILWAINGLKADAFPLEKLKDAGFRIVKSDISLIKNAIETSYGYDTFYRFSEALNSFGFTFIPVGVETEEEKDLLIHLDIHYGEGYYYGRTMKEKDFIKYLNYSAK
ncbi:MAG: EAL domain-containing protein [Bacilli bacterium]|nr:EAL domain-containing protein [Bacilli bacterium]